MIGVMDRYDHSDSTEPLWAELSSSSLTTRRDGFRCFVRAMAIPYAVELTVSHSHRKPRLSASIPSPTPRLSLHLLAVLGRC